MNPYSPLFDVGGVSVVGPGVGAGGGGAGDARVGARRVTAAGGAAEGGGVEAAAAAGVLSKSAGSRLTLDTVVAIGPTGRAVASPTLIDSASGLPVLSTGAVAVAGTV